VRGRKLAQPAVREDPSRAGVEVGEAHRVAVKRVTIVERRGLSSRVRSEGARARAIGESLATSQKRSDAPGGQRCLSEPGHALRVPWVGERICPLSGSRMQESCMFGLMSGIWKRKTWAISQTPATERAGQQVMIVPTSTAPDLDSTIF
jgi:hypothetical protein